jgi:hypothetical protein
MISLSENLGYGVLVLVAVVCLLGIARAVFLAFAG